MGIMSEVSIVEHNSYAEYGDLARQTVFCDTPGCDEFWSVIGSGPDAADEQEARLAAETAICPKCGAVNWHVFASYAPGSDVAD